MEVQSGQLDRDLVEDVSPTVQRALSIVTVAVKAEPITTVRVIRYALIISMQMSKPPGRWGGPLVMRMVK